MCWCDIECLEIYPPADRLHFRDFLASGKSTDPADSHPIGKYLENIKSAKGRSASNFKLRNLVLGSKNKPQDPIILFYPVSGKEVNTTKEIKKVSLQYCKTLLTNRKPEEGYESVVKNKDFLHLQQMEELTPDDFIEIPFVAFLKACKNIRKKWSI